MTKRKYLCSVMLTLILVVAGTVPALAQDEVPLGVWQKEIKVGLNLLQSSYSNNWNGSEKGSVVWTGNLDARFENQFSEKSNWRNYLKLAYGQTHNQERDADGALNWTKPDKTDDIIDLESFYRRTLGSGWDPYVAFNFTSLFQDLTDVYGRELNFNPMTFKESAGLSKKLIDTEKRKLMTRAGIAFIQNSRKFFPGDQPSTSTATQTETSTEVAAEWITEYRTLTLNDRVDWESKLSFILPVSYSGKSVFEDGFISVGELPEDVASYTTSLDVDWENTFTANITKVISVKLFVRWVYDKYDNTVTPVVEDGKLINEANVTQAIRTGGQFKQTLALGFGYTYN
jgi:hypothetical protein